MANVWHRRDRVVAAEALHDRREVVVSAERAVTVSPVQLVCIQQGDVDEVEDLPLSPRRSFSGHMVYLAVAEVDTAHEAVVGGDAARLAL